MMSSSRRPSPPGPGRSARPLRRGLPDGSHRHDRKEARPPYHRGRSPGPNVPPQGTLHGHRRPTGLPELPRDEEHYQRRGGRPFDQRPKFIERAEIIREKGTNRSQFFEVRWTNTPGWTWAHPTCQATSSPPSSSPRWKTPNGS